MEAGDGVLSYGKITDEGIARLRALINQEMRASYRFNMDVTLDGVRHFGWGIGDDNPLWTDPAYAVASPYGQPVAPPSFLYTFHPTFVQVGLPGVHGFHAGTNWTYFRPVLYGDRPKTTTWVHDVVEKEGRMGGRSVIAYFRTVYSSADDAVIADVLTYSMRVERDSTRSRNKHRSWEPATWIPEQLEELEERIVAEQPRGAEPRYWEDVSIGDELPAISKGPLNLSDMIAWYVGSSPLYQPAHGLALKHFRRHPKWGYRSESGAKESGIRVHEDERAAKSAGVPAQYDLGVQRNQWLLQLLTNWIGDAGVVVRCDAEYRAFNFFGDVQTLRGRVESKTTRENGDHVVSLIVWAENQRREVTMPGSAEVILPTRGDEDGPVHRQLATRIDREEYLRSVVPDLVPLDPAR